MTPVGTGCDLTQLIELSGGELLMGSEAFYAEERPVRTVTVSTFSIEQHPVTNAQYAAFVADTSYVTVAERSPDPVDYPGTDPADLVPGSLVFTPTSGPVPLDRWDLWWRWQRGACWRHPEGPRSDLHGRRDHPVVQVCFEDAREYATWAGRDLPTEAEFEYAARGGLVGADYAWGNEPRPGGRLLANTWQGRFPYRNEGAEGWVGTSPVGAFPVNGFGLADLIGNIWEWTTTWFSPPTIAAGTRAPTSCCSPERPSLPCPDTLGEAAEATAIAASVAPGEVHPRRVVKGGSHLCAPEYCLRYRPAARSPQSVESATTHVGFRCVRRSGTAT